MAPNEPNTTNSPIRTSSFKNNPAQKMLPMVGELLEKINYR